MDYVNEARALAEAHGIKVSLEDQPGYFLRQVWGALPGDSLPGLVVETSFYHEEDQTWKPTVAPAWVWAKDAQAGQISASLTWAKAVNRAVHPIPGRGGVFWHGAGRKPEKILSPLAKKGTRGGLDDLTWVGAFWCDLDCASHGYTLTQGLEVLLKLPLKPSFVVFSGGGLQAVHVLSEPWSVGNYAAALEYKDYSLALYRETFQQSGLVLDESVHEAARMMRLPGFVNQKPSRGGAEARIIYEDPEARYSLSAIVAVAGDRVRARVSDAPSDVALTPTSERTGENPQNPNPTGIYAVTRHFVAHLVEGQRPAETEGRHAVVLRLALESVQAGIPRDQFQRGMLRQLGIWASTGSFERSFERSELERISLWAYERSKDRLESPASLPLVELYPVRWDEDKSTFVLITGDEGKGSSEGSSGNATELDPSLLDTLTVTLEPEGDAPTSAPPTFGIEEIRQAQGMTVREYLKSKHADIGTYLLLRSAPGVGKSHLIIQVAEEIATAPEWKAAQRGRGKVAILSMFALSEDNWREWVRGFGGNPARYMYFVARNGDPKSAGYCALKALADGVAQKRYHVGEVLCGKCPYKQECQSKWYLAQMKKAEKYPILLLRHQQGVVESLVHYRRFIFIDESPLGVVGEALQIGAEQLELNHVPVFLQDQHGSTVTALARLLSALQAMAQGTQPPKIQHYTDPQYIQFGGHALYARLMEMMGGAGIFEQALDAPEEVVKALTGAHLLELTPDSVSKLPLNYLGDLLSILRYEYHIRYKSGAQRWNSRIALWCGKLRLYPMRPFSFSRRTKVVVADATGDASLYPYALADEEGRPRAGYVYEAAPTPQSVITQYTGTNNSRRALDAPGKISIQSISGETYETESWEADNGTVTRVKALIEGLAEQHKGSLLVVAHMRLAQKLRAWDKLPILPSQVNWFGNLRGKNDYKTLQAVLVVGRQRLPDLELQASAKAWFWRDEIALDDAPLTRVEGYQGYVDGEGKRRGWRYRGYKDSRLNAYWLHSQQAETRQCYERIRPDTSFNLNGIPVRKFVYLASAVPAAPHVDQLVPWLAEDSYRLAREMLREYRLSGTEFSQSEAVKRLAERTGKTERTCRPVLVNELGYGADPVDGGLWADVFKMRSRGRTRQITTVDKTPVPAVAAAGAASITANPAVLGMSLIDQVTGWLRDQAVRVEELSKSESSLRAVQKRLAEDGLMVSLGTVRNAKKRYDQTIKKQ